MNINTDGVCTLARAELRALLAYAHTKGDERPDMATIIVEPELRRVWACDGNRALMARHKGGHFLGRAPAVMVPRESAESALRLCRADSDTVRIYAGQSATTTDGHALGAGRMIGIETVDQHGKLRGSTFAAPPDAKPVPIDQVFGVPSEHPSAPAFTLAGYALGALATFAKLGNPKLYPGPTAMDPIMGVVDDGEILWTALVMPIRDKAVTLTADAAVAWAAEIVRREKGDQRAAEVVAAAQGIHPKPLDNVVQLPAPPPKSGRKSRKRAQG